MDNNDDRCKLTRSDPDAQQFEWRHMNTEKLAPGERQECRSTTVKTSAGSRRRATESASCHVSVRRSRPNSSRSSILFTKLSEYLNSRVLMVAAMRIGKPPDVDRRRGEGPPVFHDGTRADGPAGGMETIQSGSTTSGAHRR